MSKISMSEKDALTVLANLLKYNPRITMACARERTGWRGDMLEGLIQRNQDKLGLILSRGYTFVCTVAEKARSQSLSRKAKTPVSVAAPVKPSSRCR